MKNNRLTIRQLRGVLKNILADYSKEIYRENGDLTKSQLEEEIKNIRRASSIHSLTVLMDEMGFDDDDMMAVIITAATGCQFKTALKEIRPPA